MKSIFNLGGLSPKLIALLILGGLSPFVRAADPYVGYIYPAGIQAGNCVITESGALVGVVSEVGVNWATVSTVINTDIEMGGIVSRTFCAGILEGDFALMAKNRLKLSYLPEGAQLVSGDAVVTSGKGDVYPSGLVVGQVEGVFTDPSGMTRYAVVIPDVAIDSLIEVFVVKEFDIIE